MIHPIPFALALSLITNFTLAAEFKSADECVAGAKVRNRSNESGVILSSTNSMCKVRLDGSGKEVSYLFWMLRAADASPTTDDKLVNGVYKCYASSGYLFMDIRITGPDSYEDKKGKQGSYKLDADSGKIVFGSGPFEKASAKLLPGPKIGLNMNGGNSYATTCGLSK